MNLGEIATFITSKVGQTDATSVALCKGFIQARYSMIYDSFAWRDSEHTETRDIDRNFVPLPDGLDRVIAIRSNGDTFLDPVNINLLMQTDPTILTRKGLPTCYREFTSDSVKYIQVFPAPVGVVSLFIVGKRTVDSLSVETDVPILRNIDNVLIAYAMGDMLERQRQYDKAQAKFTEAAAMLVAAQQLETSQANQPRQSKQLTVAGNSLAELTDQVCATTGAWGLADVVLAKNFLRKNYQMIWDACNWSEATVCATVNNDGNEVILPVYFDRVLSVRFDPGLAELSVVEPSLVFGIAPTIFEQTGTSVGFTYLTPVGVSILPPTREKLTLYSTSANDKSPVFIKGELEGSEVSESVTLNGTVPVQTVNLYDTPLTVAKQVTSGDVLIYGNTTGARLERILAGERERKHMRLWLQPTPDAAQVLLILGKRTMQPFVQDEDTTMLRDIGTALIASSAADMFSKMGNKDGAIDQRAKAQAAMKTLIDLEINQGAYSARVLPYTESGYADDWAPSFSKMG